MPVRKSAQTATTLKPSTVEEWDFSHCPDEELEHCCYYEYARDSDKIKAQVTQLRSSVYQHPSGLYPGDADFYQDRWFRTFFGLFSEFPDTPWLRIPSALRQQRCTECRKWDAPFMSVYPERLLNQEEVYPYFPTDTGTFSLHSVHVVEVDWSASKHALKRAFEKWLDLNDPTAEAHLDQTGRVSDHELLKYLGAYRLLRDAKNKWELADAWAEKFGLNTKWTPRYSDERGWKRAKQHARKMINEGVALTPAASLINKLNFSKLSATEKARVKVRIAQMKRAEIRKLGKQKADAALTEIMHKVEQERRQSGA